MTWLIVSIFGNETEQIRRDRDAAVELGADLIELRVDLMEGVSDDDVRSLRDANGAPVILTLRSNTEGGRWDGPDDARIDRMIELAPVADYIDVELATWQRSAAVRLRIGQALKRGGGVSRAGGREEDELPTRCELILSRHDLASRPPTLQADFLAMLREEACRVPKLVWRARTIRDNFEAFELMRGSPCPAIVICLGEPGLLSRVLAKKFGALATFAAAASGAESAAGQLSIAEMKDLYRWDALDENTHVYGVIGDPVRHSLSPRVHNAAFSAAGMNAVYLPMQVGPSYESFKAFMAEVQARPWLDFRGFSVTIPHKENAVRFLREVGGELDPSAARAGAVNTLTLAPEGRLTGHNTDGTAAIQAICAGLNCPKGKLGGLQVAVLGAGGVSRAIVGGLTEAGSRITVFNRTEEKAKRLAEAFGCRHLPWDERVRADAGLVVNCTSVGLWPNVDASPMPAEALKGGTAVFDTVYNPLRTRLLREASEHGCTTIDGMGMFVLQAEAQFRLWTGRDPAPEVFRQAAESRP